MGESSRERHRAAEETAAGAMGRLPAAEEMAGSVHMGRT